MSETSLAESAQAIFCSIADDLGSSKMDKVLDIKRYPTFTDFKNDNQKLINDALKYIDVDENYKDIAVFLEKKLSWYISSVSIGKTVVKDLKKQIDPQFSIAKSGYQSKGFNWFRGDSQVMKTIDLLFRIANKGVSTKKSLWGDGNSTSDFFGFGNPNKWNPADIYYANDTAKKALTAELTRAQKLGTLYGFSGGEAPVLKANTNSSKEIKKPEPSDGLNVFIARLIDGGHLLPLSLKKSGTSVVLKPVNFSEDIKRKLLDSIQFDKHEGWTPYKRLDTVNKFTPGYYDPVSFAESWYQFSKKGGKTSTRDIRLKFTGVNNAKGEIKIRHDPSVKRLVAEVIYGGAKAKAGSVASATQFAQIWESVDPTAGKNFLTKYGAADIIFRAQKELFKDQKIRLRNKDDKAQGAFEYDHYVAIVSAENIINAIMGGSQGLKKWFDPTKDEKHKAEQTQFIRLLYQVATSRAPLSSRFVIAK